MAIQPEWRSKPRRSGTFGVLAAESTWLEREQARESRMAAKLKIVQHGGFSSLVEAGF
jgi:hypothetical protein